MNRLNLPDLEFNDLYKRHLLLSEVLIVDISLYILSICFIRRKIIVSTLKNETEKISILNSLEDRFINGIVACKIAIISKNRNNEFYDCAYHLFKNKTNLSHDELFYMALIYSNGYGKVVMNKSKGLELYQLAVEKGSISALINIGSYYININNYNMATKCFEKAIDLPLAKSHLAHMLECYDPKDFEKSKLLYISAAQQGDKYAINRCKVLGLRLND